MSISDFDRHHIQEILDKPDDYTWFTAQLIRLIARADDFNKRRLAKAFPEEFLAYNDWFLQTGPYAIEEASR